MAAELTVHPSMKRAWFSLALCVAFAVLLAWFWRTVVPDAAWWIMLAALLPLVAPMTGWLDVKRTELRVEDGLVHYRRGLLRRTTRAFELRKLQDVRVERTLWQRAWGVGTLILETMSEGGSVVLQNIDRPQQVADWILKSSSKEGQGRANV